jgi:ribosomal protein S14
MTILTQNWKEHKSKLAAKLMPQLSWLKCTKNLPQKKQPYMYQAKHILSKSMACASDQKRRSRFEHHECYKRTVKSILTAQACYEVKNSLTYDTKNIQACRLNVLALTKAGRGYNNRQGSITVVRNRCVVSGRNNTVAAFGLSRIYFRRYAGLGWIPGLVKI